MHAFYCRLKQSIYGKGDLLVPIDLQQQIKVFVLVPVSLN